MNVSRLGRLGLALAIVVSNALPITQNAWARGFLMLIGVIGLALFVINPSEGE